MQVDELLRSHLPAREFRTTCFEHFRTTFELARFFRIEVIQIDELVTPGSLRRVEPFPVTGGEIQAVDVRSYGNLVTIEGGGVNLAGCDPVFRVVAVYGVEFAGNDPGHVQANSRGAPIHREVDADGGRGLN